MKQQWTKWVGGIVLASGLVAQASAAEKITVFAAASLTNALQDIATQYQKRQGRAGGFLLCVILDAGAPN
ncbi:Molybdate-binding periplasmic protein precursor [Serratia marcescens]|uniref:Molybdate-binding periplasmic protein n=1 Tax=Serratia marcescens TaxID=615 RepID=A0A380AJG6_SERMA|nr:Molybdate-binding periplasmic protein precursor [Serratia marcescens]